MGVLDASLAKVELQLGGKDWTKDYAKEFLNLNLKRSPTDVVKNTDNIVEASVNIATKTFKKITDIPAAELAVKGVAAPVKGIVKGAKAYDDWATKIYAREDQMFRVALYMDRMEKGVAKLKALNLKGENYSKAFQSLKRASAQEARKGFIDYDCEEDFDTKEFQNVLKGFSEIDVDNEWDFQLAESVQRFKEKKKIVKKKQGCLWAGVTVLFTYLLSV